MKSFKRIVLNDGAQFPGILSAPSLGTDSSGNVVAGTGGSAATPVNIPAGATFNVAANTQQFFHVGLEVDGVLQVDGYLIGV